VKARLIVGAHADMSARKSLRTVSASRSMFARGVDVGASGARALSPAATGAGSGAGTHRVWMHDTASAHLTSRSSHTVVASGGRALGPALAPALVARVALKVCSAAPTRTSAAHVRQNASRSNGSVAQ
jgi:hypothetical protein